MPLLVDNLRNPERVKLLSAVAREKLEDGRRPFYETLFQNLIHWQPECLPIGDIEPRFSGQKAVCRALPLSRGGRGGVIDNLLVSASGRICLVECTLMQNGAGGKEIARKIQNCISAFSRLGYDPLVAAIKKTKDASGDDPLAQAVIGQRATKAQREAFRDRIDKNLKKGPLLLLLVGDRLRPEADPVGALLRKSAAVPFSFGMIEMAIYSPGDSGPYVLQPRLIAKSKIAVRRR